MWMNKRYLSVALLALLAIIVAGCGPKVGDVSGKVLDAGGKGISGATVRIDDLVTTTNGGGAFSLKKVPQGLKTVEVVDDGKVVNRTVVEIVKQPTAVEIVVARASVSGTITDAEGKALQSTITVNDVSVTSDAKGAFSVDGVFYGTQPFVVSVDGTPVHTEQVTIDKPSMAVAIALPPPCPDMKNAPTDAKLVYCQTFSDSDSLAALGVEPVAGWAIVDAHGKKWLQSPDAGASSTMVNVPEMANANKIYVEYTTFHVAEDSKIWGVNLMANEFPGGPARRGGTNFWAISWGPGMRMRRITNNSYPGVDDPNFLESAFGVSRGVPSVHRFVYDHQEKTVDFYVDGTQAPGYPWRLSDDQLIKGDDHTMIMFYSSGTSAVWTDVKVWVAK